MRSRKYFILIAVMCGFFLSLIGSHSFGEKTSKELRFVIVKEGKLGDPKCIKNYDPCLIPDQTRSLAVENYSFKEATNDPRTFSLEFGAKDAQKISAFTAKNVGEHLALIINEKVIASPLIRDKISGPKMQLSLSG